MIVDKRYTLDEIDRLRRATWTWYHYATRTEISPSEVEEKVRTFMMNGTDPAEIEEKIAERKRLWTAVNVLRNRA